MQISHLSVYQVSLYKFVEPERLAAGSSHLILPILLSQNSWTVAVTKLRAVHELHIEIGRYPILWGGKRIGGRALEAWVSTQLGRVPLYDQSHYFRT